jgi:hypothetical protein
MLPNSLRSVLAAVAAVVVSVAISVGAVWLLSGAFGWPLHASRTAALSGALAGAAIGREWRARRAC